MKIIKGIIDRSEEKISAVEVDNLSQDFKKITFPKNGESGDFGEIQGERVTTLRMKRRNE